MASTVADLTPAELRAMMEEVVREQLEEMLADPDHGLELREAFVRRIEERRQRLAAGETTLSLDEAIAAAERD